MVHPSLRQEDTFRKLSAETNFFAFYFQQNTRQQLWAANALKAQGWRFHTQARFGSHGLGRASGRLVLL